MTVGTLLRNCFCRAFLPTVWHGAVQHGLEKTSEQSLHQLVYLSHPQLHLCCFTHKSHCVRALETKQMELVGNRMHANYGSFDWRYYLIIRPSGHLGEESINAAYCTICVSNCYNTQPIMSYTKTDAKTLCCVCIVYAEACCLKTL